MTTHTIDKEYLEMLCDELKIALVRVLDNDCAYMGEEQLNALGQIKHISDTLNGLQSSKRSETEHDATGGTE